MYSILGKEYNCIDSIKDKLYWIGYGLFFEPFEGSFFCTDIGWGCTIRSSQMMLCNILLETFNEDKSQLDLIKYEFRNIPESKLSIHNYVKHYVVYGKKPGDWLGPYTVSSLLEYFKDYILSTYNIEYKNISTREIYIEKEAFSNNILLSIPLRICNMDEMKNNILFLMKLSSFTGIIGGISTKCFFIIGIHNEELVYLDPHYIRFSQGPVPSIGYMDLNELCSTFTITFIIKNYDEYLKFKNNIQNNLPCLDKPLFTFLDKKPKNPIKYSSESKEDWEIIKT